MTTPTRATSRVFVLALAICLGLLSAFALVPSARADEPNSIVRGGLTFSYDGSTPAEQVATVDAAGHVVTVRAASGKVTISGAASADLQQIVVDAQNKATIELSGVTIDRLTGGDGHHALILNAPTDLIVTGENKILANSTYSAIWSPTSLSIVGEGALTVDDATASGRNAAISIIARDVTIGESGAGGPTVKGLILGGTLVYAGVTRADGTLTVNGGSVVAENPANYQQGLSAKTITINGGIVRAAMSGRNSNALSATTVDIRGGEVTASVSGANTNAISAGKVVISNGAGAGSGADGPVVALTASDGAVKAAGCPVILKASSWGNADFYPWMARGGASADAMHIASFAGAGNATTAATTGITFDAKHLEIKPQALAKLAFAESGEGNHAGSGVKSGDTIPLGLSYRFDGVEPAASDFGTAPLTTYFPVTDDTIAPYGNAESTYGGGTSGSITIGKGARGRTTSIAPEPWPLLSQIYGAKLASIIEPLGFPMRYEVALDLVGGSWGEVAGPLTTGPDGKVSVTGAPSHVDHTLSYWKTADGEAIADLASHVFDGPATLTAVWAKDTVDVTFDANGGHWGASESSITQKVEKGSTCVPPASDPTHDGKVFLGWYEAKENPTSPADFSAAIGDAKTFYAQWGTPELTLSPSETTAQAEAWVSFTATASVKDAPGGIVLPTIRPEGLKVSTKPQLNVKAPAISGARATFEVQAPHANGVVEVSAEWMGVAKTASVTVQGGVDPAGQVTLTFQANGGTIGGAPFKTVTLKDANSMTPDEVASQVGTPTNGSYQFLAWYEWIEVDGDASAIDADEVDDAPVHGYWHSVDFATKTFDRSQELTAMWADASSKTLVLWPPEATVAPSATATFQAALLSEPLNTDVLPPSSYAPAEGNRIDPEKLAISCIQGTESLGAKIGDAIPGSPEGVAEFSVVAPDKATTAYPGAVVLQASYPSGSDSAYTATARLVVEPQSAPPPPATTPPSASTYDVTLEGNGGLWGDGDAVKTVQVPQGGTVSVPSGLSNPGSELMGWCVRDASGAWRLVDLATFEVSGPVTLTAEWGKAIHRLYEPATGAHLLTSDANEARVLTTQRGWLDEGVRFHGYDAAAPGRVPIMRLYHPSNGDHLFTADANEAKVLASRGWLDEGVRFYGAAPGEGRAVYRLWNTAQRALDGLGSHLWTVDAHEYRVLPSMPSAGAWNQEGIAWYAPRVPDVASAQAGVE